jgi:hypothetical protein
MLEVVRNLEKEIEEINRLRNKAAFELKDKETSKQLRKREMHLKAKLCSMDKTLLNLAAPTSCLIFDSLHPFRVVCRKTVESTFFSALMSTLLLYNCACLALQRRDIPAFQSELVNISNVVLNLIFGVELVVRIIALSFTVFIRSNFNKLDSVLVCIGIADAVVSLLGQKVPLFCSCLLKKIRNVPFFDESFQVSLSTLRILRTVRALKPLRLLLRYSVFQAKFAMFALFPKFTCDLDI